MVCDQILARVQMELILDGHAKPYIDARSVRGSKVRIADTAGRENRHIRNLYENYVLFSNIVKSNLTPH